MRINLPRFFLSAVFSIGLLASGRAASPAASAPPALPTLPESLVALAPASLVAADEKPKLYSRLDGENQAVLTRLPDLTPGVVAYRLDNPARHQNHYAVEALWRTSRPVQKGAALLARFHVRTLFARQEAGEAAFGFYFQQTAQPWHKSTLTRLSVGMEWQLIELPFQAAGDYAPGEVAAYLSFAFYPQSLEFTMPEVLDFGDRVAVDDLPKTRFTYAGREPDAAWRSEALARIEELRVSPLNIIVRDANGRPVPDARVKARLDRPEFIFGSEIDTEWIMKDTPDAERYRQTSLELFCTLTPGSGLKWHRWFFPTASPGRRWTRDETLKALDWLYAQDVRVKGHVLVWGGWGFTPRPVREMSDKAERDRRLPGMIEDFIRQVTAATKDRLEIWEVLNEPLNEPDYINLLGEEAAAGWFKLARELAPQAQLFINDYRMLTGGESRDMVEKYLALIARLRAHGAPIDGIGIQGHFGQQMPGIPSIKADMDLLASAGLPIHITEFDINTTDEALQADFTRDFLILCYSHPGFTGFINWGYWEGTHWLPLAAMYRKDWSIKPNGQVWRDLVLGEWRTRIDATTSPSGEVAARGHRGRYRIEITTPDGRAAELTHQLTRSAGEVVVTLP